MDVPGTTPSTPAWAVNDAIRTASRSTGASFGYLLATAKVESNLDPDAASSSSSARGLFQFIDQTWLMMLKEAGPSLGLGRYADAISKTSSGRYEVTDPAVKQEVMSLRNDARANAAMAGAFAQRNAALLEARIGRSASEGELYIAHFLGAGGGSRLINEVARNPGGIAAETFPNAAAANRSIFYDRSGTPRTFSQVYDDLVGRYERARVGTTQMASAAAVQPVAAATATARPDPDRPTPVIDRPAAGAAPLFHSLYQSEAPRAGVSSFVSELWSTRPHVAAALSGVAAQPTTAASSTTASSTTVSTTAASTATSAPVAITAPTGSRAGELFAAPGNGVGAMFGTRS